MAGGMISRMRACGAGLVLAAGLAFPAGAETLAGDYLAARQASFLGDYSAAAEYYGRAIAHDPANPELLERATLAHMSLGEMERAAALAERLADEGYDSQVGHMAEVATLAKAQDFAGLIDRVSEQRAIGPLVDGLVAAWSELGRGDMSAALVAFDELAKEKGLAGFAAYHKALALASVGDFEGADAVFAGRQAGSMQTTRRAIEGRVQILSQLDREDEAIALIDETFGPTLDPRLTQLRAALEADDTLPFSLVRTARDGVAEVFYTLAGALSSEANDDFTLLYARISQFLRPEHSGAILMTATLLEKLGQHDLAVAAYKTVPRDDPDFHAAEMGRADALRASGKPDAAIEVLEQLAASHGDMPAVQSALGDVLRQQERYEEAIEAYGRALDTFEEPDPAQWFLHYARGISHERLSHWDAAEEDFRAALELNPEQPQVLNYLGYSLVERQEKLDEALSMIESAVSAQPQSGYIVDSLGWALYRLGKYEEAVVHMERAAELMPVDPVVNDHLGDVYWAVGREVEAEFQWKRALSFATWDDASDEVDMERIRQKLEVGLDQVLAEEGAPPLRMANGD
ncbi:tetratricopeptide repeat protein [Salipiger mucosus]|uniref:TPR domain protein n=1 Tax=Salipiger mucosus DSM 16094 TaxID=1123237 RepID=S9QTN4_9RHOB|nr:tetratricopeptide repeat protein [Salipiger mucosus]EPX83008.1 TPR domain protein [Salipiger mucosus DSM 16094]